jgi:hypothetical protein
MTATATDTHKDLISHHDKVLIVFSGPKQCYAAGNRAEYGRPDERPYVVPAEGAGDPLAVVRIDMNRDLRAFCRGGAAQQVGTDANLSGSAIEVVFDFGKGEFPSTPDGRECLAIRPPGFCFIAVGDLADHPLLVGLLLKLAEFEHGHDARLCLRPLRRPRPALQHIQCPDGGKCSKDKKSDNIWYRVSRRWLAACGHGNDLPMRACNVPKSCRRVGLPVWRRR